MTDSCQLTMAEITSMLSELVGGQFQAVRSLPASAPSANGRAAPSGLPQPIAPPVESLPAGGLRISVPLGAIVGTDTVVVGECRRSAAEMLNALPSMAIKYLAAQGKIRELEHCLDDYSRYVSQHLEELTWLRALAQHLEQCGKGEELAAVAGRLLPSLKDMISAKQVVMVRARDEADASAPAAGIASRSGTSSLSAKQCVDFTNWLLGEYGDGPIVRNDLARLSLPAELPPLDSCILVPVRTAQALLGWLLALDKQPPQGHLSSHLSEQEFGTVEASLLATAAAMIALSQQCARLEVCA